MERTSFFMAVSFPGCRQCKRHGGDIPRRSRQPGAATFPNDVPTGHPFFKYVEALAAAGMTGGCGSGSYCPDSPMTRGQMAVLLGKALGLHWPN